MPATKRRRRRRHNKSQLIRDYLQLHPEHKPRVIQAGIKEQSGVLISTQMISTVKTKELGGRKGRGRPGRKGRAAMNGLSASDLIQAKHLADQMGGVERAKQALDTLVELQ